MASLTQLRYSMAGPTGLDYQGLLAAAQMLGISLTPEVFRLIHAAEAAFLSIMAEKARTGKND